jgi:hypothetical protein
LLNAMTRKETLLIAFTLVFGVLYACFFTDWFRHRPIHIDYTIRPYVMPMRRPGSAADSTDRMAYSITFALDREYKLTSIKVVPAGAFSTNKNVQPLWHLVADSAPEPTKGFIYGGDVPGMQPFVSGAQPTPLEPGVEYRLIAVAGRSKGERDFTITAQAAARR